ncbi:MAG: ComEC/Rec2 family competence protein [Candidatus Omnitrophica bacterium]|nr:ComEC/Rec2 family competence protein [Candidatus Omnitrophota bacterium]
MRDDTWIPHAGRAQRRGWLEIERIKRADAWVPASGKVQFRLPAREGPVRVGDRLRCTGMIRAGHKPVPGTVIGTRYRSGFDEQTWLWVEGACGVLAVSDPESLAVLPGGPSLWFRYQRWVGDFRWRLQELGRSLLPPTEAGFLEAFLLGEGRGIPADVKQAFRQTGTIHILVVSGFQVGLIGVIALTVLSLLRLPRGARYLLTGLALLLYCALTGAAPPILRATVMGLAVCLAQYQGREVSPLNLLGAAGLLILASDPRALADVGFQLSFAAVLGILVGTRWYQVPTAGLVPLPFRPALRSFPGPPRGWPGGPPDCPPAPSIGEVSVLD